MGNDDSIMCETKLCLISPHCRFFSPWVDFLIRKKYKHYSTYIRKSAMHSIS